MKHLLRILLLSVFFNPSLIYAAATPLKTFTQGSYQALMNQYKNQPLVLIVWSTTCPSCLKEMNIINSLHKSYPKLNFVMLTVDDNLAVNQINEILEKNQLTDLENWLFSEDNSEKLRFEIDPTWYGELPRTYFFNAAHQRTAISGVLPIEKYKALLNQISK